MQVLPKIKHITGSLLRKKRRQGVDAQDVDFPMPHDAATTVAESTTKTNFKRFHATFVRLQTLLGVKSASDTPKTADMNGYLNGYPSEDHHALPQDTLEEILRNGKSLSFNVFGVVYRLSGHRYLSECAPSAVFVLQNQISFNVMPPRRMDVGTWIAPFLGRVQLLIRVEEILGSGDYLEPIVDPLLPGHYFVTPANDNVKDIQHLVRIDRILKPKLKASVPTEARYFVTHIGQLPVLRDHGAVVPLLEVLFEDRYRRGATICVSETGHVSFEHHGSEASEDDDDHDSRTFNEEISPLTLSSSLPHTPMPFDYSYRLAKSLPGIGDNVNSDFDAYSREPDGGDVKVLSNTIRIVDPSPMSSALFRFDPTREGGTLWDLQNFSAAELGPRSAWSGHTDSELWNAEDNYAISGEVSGSGPPATIHVGPLVVESEDEDSGRKIFERPLPPLPVSESMEPGVVLPSSMTSTLNSRGPFEHLATNDVLIDELVLSLVSI
ncbi:hypothetical protein DFP72DRAFT_894843 [Ephemerocybe angulata]|uniref:Uncharacterized protein n=1 Tax=Ephemerocybe angulata TaxID=980116 RepID=A0A8H6I1H6_9AGAR|nr:hypothetical protein DFP72DRAFT_894843 [Tulosesus angulatus]